MIYVGTSGWVYDWNRDGTLEWYVRYSGFNAVEVNMSFYRVPRRRLVERWVRVGSSLRWSVKVNRVITHFCRLSEKALEHWRRFREVFRPLEDSGLLDFYLLQLPPSYVPSPEYVRRLVKFVEEVNLGPKLAIEFRCVAWFKGDYVRLLGDYGVTWVSVDAPDLPRVIYTSNGIVYVRMHGRAMWYTYRYSRDELEEVARNIASVRPRKVYVFFNNDHDMLDNGREMMLILQSMVKRGT